MRGAVFCSSICRTTKPPKLWPTKCTVFACSAAAARASSSAFCESAARIELRSPDPACNPYLAFAVLAAAGLRGIEQGYDLPAELDGTPETAGPRLPADLGEALDLFERSELARDVLGEQLRECFVRNKRREWDGYRATVTDSERRGFPGLL